MKKLFSIFAVILFLASYVSAGIGISVTANSILVEEGKQGVYTVGAYNPFNEPTYVTVLPSDELSGVLIKQSAQQKLVPAGTSSENAIPLSFEFKVPQVYERETKLLGLAKKVDCTSQDKVSYEGEVVLQSVPGSDDSTGFGGSATVMAVSTPLTVRVACKDTHGWDYTLAYVVVAVFSAGVVGMILFTRYRKPKSERLKEQMKKIRDEMRKGRKK